MCQREGKNGRNFCCTSRRALAQWKMDFLTGRFLVDQLSSNVDIHRWKKCESDEGRAES